MTNSERNKKIYACHKNGKSQQEIGEIFGLSQSAVSKIVIAERTGVPKPKQETRGAKPKLTDTKHKQLKEYLSKKPSVYGYKVWNKWSIQILVKDKFNIKYSPELNPIEQVWAYLKKQLSNHFVDKYQDRINQKFFQA